MVDAFSGAEAHGEDLEVDLLDRHGELEPLGEVRVRRVLQDVDEIRLPGCGMQKPRRHHFRVFALTSYLFLPLSDR